MLIYDALLCSLPSVVECSARPWLVPPVSHRPSLVLCTEVHVRLSLFVKSSWFTVSLLSSIKHYFCFTFRSSGPQKILRYWVFAPVPSWTWSLPITQCFGWQDKQINHNRGTELCSGSDWDLDPCIRDSSSWPMIWHNSCFPNTRTSIKNLWKLSVPSGPVTLVFIWFYDGFLPDITASLCSAPLQEDTDSVTWSLPQNSCEPKRLKNSGLILRRSFRPFCNLFQAQLKTLLDLHVSWCPGLNFCRILTSLC